MVKRRGLTASCMDERDAYLLKQRKLAVGTVASYVAALRFFFVRTLKRPGFREFLPYPRERQRLPGILSKEEVARLINSSGNLFQRTLLMVLYARACGEQRYVSRLKVSDIDSQRMIPKRLGAEIGFLSIPAQLGFQRPAPSACPLCRPRRRIFPRPPALDPYASALPAAHSGAPPRLSRQVPLRTEAPPQQRSA
jgi:hypothetical protein